jgi:hypothetical protein
VHSWPTLLCLSQHIPRPIFSEASLEKNSEVRTYYIFQAERSEDAQIIKKKKGMSEIQSNSSIGVEHMNGNSESVQAPGLDRARQCERKIKDTTTITLEESNIPDAT